MTGVEVDVEGPASVEGVVGSDGVESVAVGLDFAAEVEAVVDLVAVEVLVLQRLEAAFADAVVARALDPGADVDELGAAGDELWRSRST